MCVWCCIQCGVETDQVDHATRWSRGVRSAFQKTENVLCLFLVICTKLLCTRSYWRNLKIRHSACIVFQPARCQILYDHTICYDRYYSDTTTTFKNLFVGNMSNVVHDLEHWIIPFPLEVARVESAARTVKTVNVATNVAVTVKSAANAKVGSVPWNKSRHETLC